MKQGSFVSAYNFPNYIVTRNGRVYSKGTFKEKKPSSYNGYLKVDLYKNGKYKKFYVHRLVLLSFVGNPDSKDMQAAHLNGIKSDNRLSNLKWCSRSENESHKIFHGKSNMGSRNGMSRLTEANVRFIRVFVKGGFRVSDMANYYGVSKGCISNIVKMKSWKNV